MLLSTEIMVYVKHPTWLRVFFTIWFPLNNSKIQKNVLVNTKFLDASHDRIPSFYMMTFFWSKMKFKPKFVLLFSCFPTRFNAFNYIFRFENSDWFWIIENNYYFTIVESFLFFVWISMLICLPFSPELYFE